MCYCQLLCLAILIVCIILVIAAYKLGFETGAGSQPPGQKTGKAIKTSL